MKMNYKYLVLTSVLGLGLSLGFTQLLNKKGDNEQQEVVSMAGEYKAKSREKIKPYKYDGSKITYFNYLTYEQKKTIEVLMFNGIEYKFCFNSDGVPKGIDLKIYDKDAIAKERILLFESNGVAGKDVLVTSADMLKTLQSKKEGALSLKKVYIEYQVPIGDKQVEAPKTEETKKGESPVNAMERGCIVVSYGYKNV